MKLWLISQEVNTGYDTYDSAVVAAPDEDAARHVSPTNCRRWVDDCWHFVYGDGRTEPETCFDSWTDPQHVTAEYIGDGDHEAGKVICASFNAG